MFNITDLEESEINNLINNNDHFEKSRFLGHESFQIQNYLIQIVRNGNSVPKIYIFHYSCFKKIVESEIIKKRDEFGKTWNTNKITVHFNNFIYQFEVDDTYDIVSYKIIHFEQKKNTTEDIILESYILQNDRKAGLDPISDLVPIKSDIDKKEYYIFTKKDEYYRSVYHVFPKDEFDGKFRDSIKSSNIEDKDLEHFKFSAYNHEFKVNVKDGNYQPTPIIKSPF
ncbi:MAG: hypothetical protein K0R07_30 [Sedimentibacter sp.]|jgi:hypothetical protein|nr:hypothetical protein [Sedimentibacter sp.]